MQLHSGHTNWQSIFWVLLNRFSGLMQFPNFNCWLVFEKIANTVSSLVAHILLD